MTKSELRAVGQARSTGSRTATNVFTYFNEDRTFLSKKKAPR